MLKPALEAQFQLYADYHRHPMNRLTHKLAIPLIVFHVLAMLSWVSLGSTVGRALGFPLHLGHLAYLAAVAWYLRLDARLGLLMALLLALGFPLSAVTPRPVVVGIALSGWLIQLAGHLVWEKRSPAFLTNLLQALIGPLFFVAVLVGVWPARRAEVGA